jgi:hypothetical protein
MGKKKVAQVMKPESSGSFLAEKPTATSRAEVSGIQQPTTVPEIIDPKIVLKNLKDLFLSRFYKKLENLIDNLDRDLINDDDIMLVLYKLNKLIDSYNPDNLIKAINILTMRSKEKLSDDEYIKRVLEVK